MSARLNRRLKNASETMRFGAALGQVLSAPQRVYLRGDLGAGKTCLVRAWLRALGYSAPVKSPTYTLVEPHEIGEVRCFHLDLYRVVDPLELEAAGILETLAETALIFVEWPENGGAVLPPPDVTVDLSYVENQRDAIVVIHGANAQVFAERIGSLFESTS